MSDIRATVKPIYLLAFSTFVAVIAYIVFWLILGSDSPIFSIVNVLVILAVAVLAYRFRKVPFKVMAVDKKLLTYGLNGKHSIDLEKLKNTSTVWTFGGPVMLTGNHGLDIELLKLSDSSGRSIYLQLGGLSTVKRQAISSLVADAFKSANIQAKEAEELLQSWNKP
jgi:hypothetical protein